MKKWNGLLGCKGEPMSTEMSMIFLNFTMTEMSVGSGKAKPEVVMEIDKKLENYPLYQILKKRLEVFKENFSPNLDVGILPMAFCATISDRPGSVVMWAYTLNEIFVKTGKPVTMEALTQEFPWGFPNKDEMEKCWDAQKIKRIPGGTDNSVDDFKTWSVPG